jgi:phosphate starvation-inducible PhoH-like protein
MKTIGLRGEEPAILFGARDANLRYIESAMGVRIRTHGSEVLVEGESGNEVLVETLFNQLVKMIADGYDLVDGDIKTAARLLLEDANVSLNDYLSNGLQRSGLRHRARPKSINQRRYLESIETHDIVFGVGPAGTGKTYLAMSEAVSYLTDKKVRRIILARPAVEAGEKLGFLPGDLQEKVNPYLRPLYDALYDMLDADKAARLLERGTIEVAPLAFMRGRTLNDAFVILDEAQNTTSEQMKMFLTRLGFGSKAVITGDITQIDLPTGRRSGLIEAISVVRNVPGIGFVNFDERDVVRHQLVQKIVKAYDIFTSDSQPNG